MNRAFTPGFDASVLHRLEAFAAHFADDFNRPRWRAWCGVYLAGMLQDDERKSIEPLSRRITLAERLTTIVAIESWDVAEGYWRLAAQWFRMIKKPDVLQRCHLAADGCVVAKIEKGLQIKELRAGYASHWMKQAAEAFRQAKAEPSRIKEVYHRFLELERRFVEDD